MTRYCVYDYHRVATWRNVQTLCQVTASNPISSQSQQLLLSVDEMTPLAEPEFVLVNEVTAVNATQSYRLRVKVDISMPVTFK